MSFSFLRIAIAAFLVVLIALGNPCLGDDYLVIKKKGGNEKRVPLGFDPTQIESFRLESKPAKDAEKKRLPPGDEETSPPPSREFEEAPGAKPEAKPMEISPGAPSDQPSVRGRRPAEGRVPLAGEAKKKRAAGPISAPPISIGKGAPFTANIYELPDHVKALPDYSAMRPTKTISADTINLYPEKGLREPAGIPDDAQGLGMRFQGVFLVSGEGIFRWRVFSKDGVRLHIDDKTLLENDGLHDPASRSGFVHLAEGVHTIIVDSFNSAGPPVLQLFVTPPLGPEEVFSISKGLRGWKDPTKPYDVLWGQVYFVPQGKYPSGPKFDRISPIGRLIAPSLNISGGEGFPGLPARRDMVGIKYEGFFKVEGAGIFAFRLAADNYAKLIIGKDEIIESNKFGPDGKLGWAFLQKGAYPIKVEYFHERGQPRLELFVTAPQKAETLFSPADVLQGYASESEKISLVPAFVYFLKEGTKKLPNYNKMSPSGMFFTKAIDYPLNRGSKQFPGVPKRESWLGLRFYVKFTLTAEEEGTYKFRVVAQDGARLIIGKKIVVNALDRGTLNDKSGSVTLKAGSHEMFLDYFQTTGPSALQLFITPPGGQEKIFAFQ